jgi:hypothetical protein
VIAGQPHNENHELGPDRCTDRVERLAQPEARSTNVTRLMSATSASRVEPESVAARSILSGKPKALLRVLFSRENECASVL